MGFFLNVLTKSSTFIVCPSSPESLVLALTFDADEFHVVILASIVHVIPRQLKQKLPIKIWFKKNNIL